MQVRDQFVAISVSALVIVGLTYLVWQPILWSLIILLPLIVIGVYDMLQVKHTILRNYPIVGHFRYLLERFRPELMQYFVETDTQGRPINRISRSMVYERAKNENDTTPFGTQEDVYSEGYEWMEHSIYAKSFDELDNNPRVEIGGKDCKQHYSSSVLNISAMSFGSLSKNAVLALNKGAQIGGFAHNTGEGGISSYHLEHGGDLIWQVGTGYFGCRTKDGNFSPELFRKNASLSTVKMIELKLSQGAKPGHGGLLPAAKNTREIASIRGLEPHTTVASPPNHKAFSDAEGLLRFIKQLRDLSEGKPVGFKLCVGRTEEFVDICKAMLVTGILPDFITVDGGEGGTGAAPVEFSNSIGMPMCDGLAFVANTLEGFDLRKDIKIMAAGKIISGFHMARAVALGADVCYSARAMMLALGCIQALECHENTCPTGVATQNASLMRGLVVGNKAERVASFHKKTLHSFVELVAATGNSHYSNLNRTHIKRRVSVDIVKRFDEVYPTMATGSLIPKSRTESLSPS